MADFHFSVTQIKRSAGQSAIAAAAYRAGEKLYSETYDEFSDYTRKRGIVETGILLPSFAPKEYKQREKLWNAVEQAERHPKAQLAYSFDFSLQNEFSMKENLEIAREFIQKQFVDRGMIADYAVHLPDKGDAVPNPHVHVLCPIRPLNPDGTWGAKQKRVYRLDEAGNRLLDASGRPQFDAVPTTDWGSAETLEHWREAWAEINNEHFAAHNLDARLDHRSYEKQGVDLIPTVHEGPKVREMESQGIRTERGRNRWIRQINAMIWRLKTQLRELSDWIADLKEAAKPEPSVYELLTAHLNQRNAGAWSFVAKNNNLKEHSQMVRYLQEHGITTVDELSEHIRQVNEKASPAQVELQNITKQIQRLDAIEKAFDRYQSAKPVFDKWSGIYFKKAKEKYKTAHEKELKAYYACRRQIESYLKENGDLDFTRLSLERGELTEKADRLNQETVLWQSRWRP
jgi:MobA/MobL family.